MQKQMPLVKPMMVVTTTGHIVAVLVPYSLIVDIMMLVYLPT